MSNNDKIFALVDCNNFYASCERIFNPKLINKPIVILSNNDGCIVARSNEAKDLGIKMGAPLFQYKDIIKKYDVKTFSSNYTLYGDISNRVMNSLKMMVADLEIYSIDEAFLRLDNIAYQQITKLCLNIRDNINKWLSIPTSIGIAPTKTLAKIANDLAKKKGRTLNNQNTENHIFDLRDETLQIEILKKTEIKDIWGIGQGISERLNKIGIFTGLDLGNSDPKHIRKILGVIGERIVYELRGFSCLSLSEIAPKKNIISSRSFGKKVTDKEELIEAISNYAANAHQKLIKQGSVANGICVFLRTNPFSSCDQQYRNSVIKTFIQPTDILQDLIQSIRIAVNEIYLPNYNYKKAGIILLDLSPKNLIQDSLLYNLENSSSQKNEMRKKLEDVMNKINQQQGKGTVSYAIMGIKKQWMMKCNSRSPNYTTDINNLAEVF
jgi:DNA polymerase V